MTNITLSKDSWHVRWFMWSSDVWQEFRNGHAMHDLQTNLCYYVRTTLISAPLVLLINAAVYASALICITYTPITLFGWGAYLICLGWIGLIALTIFLINKLPEKKLTEEQALAKIRMAEAKRLRKLARGPSFLSLTWHWLINQKKRVCPIINLEERKVS